MVMLMTKFKKNLNPMKSFNKKKLHKKKLQLQVVKNKKNVKQLQKNKFEKVHAVVNDCFLNAIKRYLLIN